MLAMMEIGLETIKLLILQGSQGIQVDMMAVIGIVFCSLDSIV
jgi:hypothetical protein